MFSASVILRPRSEVHSELQLQERSLQDAVNSLSPRAVLVRTQVAGVCHTDLHIWHGYYKVGRANAVLGIKLLANAVSVDAACFIPVLAIQSCTILGGQEC